MTHVLVAIDGSDPAWTAFEYALERFEGEQITVIHVVDPMDAGYGSYETGFFSEEIYERALERGERICDEAVDRAEEQGYLENTVVETAVELGRPARIVVEYADDHDVDHVVVGSRGRSGLSRVLLGSVAETIVRRAPCPVTVVR